MRQFAKKVLALAIVMVAATSALGQAPAAARSSWECLPPETVMLMRVPSGKLFLEALRKQTKLGAVGLSQERFDKFTAMLQEESKTEWEKMGQDLAKYNLKTQDWNDLLVGEAGLGVVLAPRPGKAPLVMALSWVEPGGDLAERLVKALEKAVDEEKGKPATPTRVDSTIEGFKVMRLSMPVLGTANGKPPAIPADFGQMTPEQRTEWFKKQQEARKDEPRIQIDQTQLFVTRVGNRILIGNTFPQHEAEIRELKAKGDVKVDLDALTGVEQATGVYARFLAAHNAKAADGVAASLMATPGLAAAMPAGMAGFELLVDPRPLVKMLDPKVDPKASPDAARAIKALGFNTIGPAALRLSLDGTVLRSGGFLSVPAPRTGLVTLFDQAAIAPEPPAWVPANLLGYSQVSFDLGKAYLRVKELVVGEWGPQAQQGFDQAEMQVKGMLQVDLPVLLSSLGSRHSFLTYGPLPKPAAAAAAAGDAPAPAARPSPNDENRMAFVWQLLDEPLWSRVLGVVAPFTGQAAVQEQGFNGLRIQQPQMEAGVFVGKGFMTIGLGKGVTESTLAWLRTPPQGAAAMATSPIFQRGKALLTLEPSMMFQVSDAGRSMRIVREAVINAAEQATARRGMMRRATGRGPAAPRLFANAFPALSPLLSIQAADEAPEEGGEEEGPEGPAMPQVDPADAAHGKATAARLRAILPTDQEMEGMFGASVQQVIVKAQGVVAQGALELPPPGK
ncbi:MAG: hypothetical protein NTW19_20895 [Planctomycetota bacterium]|nr:hypothetical protein [Planctomycetota bacterium]